MLDLIVQSSFTEVAALLVLAAIMGFIGILLRQPLIVSFIVVGLIAGPSVLDIVQSQEQIELLSELGIAVLLFLVGIKLDVKLIRSIGGVSALTGLGQVAFTSILGYFIGLAIGLDHITSIYVAVALTFSSTIIIVKLLSDKREIDSLHGQIALGFLIVQDLVVVMAMIVLAAIGIGTGHDLASDASAWNVAISGIGLLLFVILFVRYIADPLTEKLAKATELLVVYAIAQTALFAAIGESVATRLKDTGIRVLGLDFNPAAIKYWRHLGLDTGYGDVTDAEFVAELPLRHAKWVVSAIPHHQTGVSSEDMRKTIIQLTRAAGFTGQVATVSQSKMESEELKLLGVDLVLEPFQDAADRACELLLEGLDFQPDKPKANGEPDDEQA